MQAARNASTGGRDGQVAAAFAGTFWTMSRMKLCTALADTRYPSLPAGIFSR